MEVSDQIIIYSCVSTGLRCDWVYQYSHWFTDLPIESWETVFKVSFQRLYSLCKSASTCKHSSFNFRKQCADVQVRSDDHLDPFKLIKDRKVIAISKQEMMLGTKCLIRRSIILKLCLRFPTRSHISSYRRLKYIVWWWSHLQFA